MKRELWLPLALVGVGLAFAAVCVGLALWRRNGWLLQKKLRIGALLLGLSGAATGVSGCPISCYAGPGQMITLAGEKPYNTAVLDLLYGNTLDGRIEHGYYDERFAFIFILSTPDGGELQRGDLVPLDGAFDDDDEAFRLTIRPDVELGRYGLCICRGHAERLPDDTGSDSVATEACFDLLVVRSDPPGE